MISGRVSGAVLPVPAIVCSRIGQAAWRVARTFARWDADEGRAARGQGARRWELSEFGALVFERQVDGRSRHGGPVAREECVLT